jgi:ABC-type molybdate transport system permease subunit
LRRLDHIDLATAVCAARHHINVARRAIAAAATLALTVAAVLLALAIAALLSATVLAAFRARLAPRLLRLLRPLWVAPLVVPPRLLVRALIDLRVRLVRM